MKKRINVKPQAINAEENPKYMKLKDLIDNLDDDLVIDEVSDQLIKCPITGKPIQKAFKNKCGHSYEYDAIVNYCKGRNITKRYCREVDVKLMLIQIFITTIFNTFFFRCPYAGCANTVSMQYLNSIK